MSETDGAMLARLGTDAELWASEFARVFRGRTDEAIDGMPGGLLHVWLCNAIEAGRTAGAGAEARTGNYAAGMAAALGADWRTVGAS